MLESARARLDHRVRSRGDRMAPQARLGARLLEAAGWLRKGRGHAGAEVARKVQRCWTHQLGWSDLRQRLRAGAKANAKSLPRQLVQRALSDAYRRTARAAALSVAHARMVSDR